MQPCTSRHFGSLFPLIGVVLGLPSFLFAQAAGAAQSWQEEFRAGTEAFQASHLSEALPHFVAVTHLAPAFAPGHYNLGLTAERMQDYDLAIPELRKALHLDPSLRGARLFLGISLYNTGQYAPAEASLREASRREPADAQAKQWLGMTYLALDRAREAAAMLDQASDLDTKNVDILYFAGHAHTLASTQAYERLYKANPESWRVHEILGEAYSQADRGEQAIAEYKEAIRLAPEERQLHYWLAVEYANSSKTTEAIEAYRAEIRLAPNSYESMYGLGRLLVQSDGAAEGVSMLRRVLAGEPTQTDAFYYLGLGEKNMGAYAEAEHDLLQATTRVDDADIRQRAFYALSQVYRAEKRPDEAKAALAQFVALKSKSDAHQKDRFSSLMKKHEPGAAIAPADAPGVPGSEPDQKTVSPGE